MAAKYLMYGGVGAIVGGIALGYVAKRLDRQREALVRKMDKKSVNYSDFKGMSDSDRENVKIIQVRTEDHKCSENVVNGKALIGLLSVFKRDRSEWVICGYHFIHGLPLFSEIGKDAIEKSILNYKWKKPVAMTQREMNKLLAQCKIRHLMPEYNANEYTLLFRSVNINKYFYGSMVANKFKVMQVSVKRKRELIKSVIPMGWLHKNIKYVRLGMFVGGAVLLGLETKNKVFSK